MDDRPAAPGAEATSLLNSAHKGYPDPRDAQHRSWADEDDEDKPFHDPTQRPSELFGRVDSARPQRRSRLSRTRTHRPTSPQVSCGRALMFPIYEFTFSVNKGSWPVRDVVCFAIGAVDNVICAHAFKGSPSTSGFANWNRA